MVKLFPTLREVVLGTDSPFADVEEYRDSYPFLREECKVLVIGAGGLGCEILKNLALSAFADISVIDMDRIDLTNLNRQFLFRKNHVGKFKAEVAAESINKTFNGPNRKVVKVTPYVGKIQDKNPSFYREFNIIIAGLDNIPARRWINNLLHSMVKRDSSGEIDISTIIPLLDGGTEGLKGQARVILPSMTSCFECSLDMFPPQQNFPLCTIAETPRLPEHCIEYALAIQWQQEFGEESIAIARKAEVNTEEIINADAQTEKRTKSEPEIQTDSIESKRIETAKMESTTPGRLNRDSEPADEKKLAEEIERKERIKTLTAQIQRERSSPTEAINMDNDSPVHMEWLYQQALQRASLFAIEGVTYQLTMGVVKRIIPAVASTNAIIAAALVQEALKIITYCGPVMNNYMMYMGHDGVYTHTFPFERKYDCLVCSNVYNGEVLRVVEMSKDATLQEFIDKLCDTRGPYQLKKPSINGGAGVVFFQNPPSLRKAHEYKLGQALSKLVEFGVFRENEELVITDPLCLSTMLKLQIKFTN